MNTVLSCGSVPTRPSGPPSLTEIGPNSITPRFVSQLQMKNRAPGGLLKADSVQEPPIDVSAVFAQVAVTGDSEVDRRRRVGTTSRG